MRIEQKRFLQYVVIGIVAVVCVARIASVLVTRLTAGTVREASRTLSGSLAGAAAALRSDNTLPVRLAQAQDILVDARDSARRTDHALGRIETAADAIGTFIPLHPSVSRVSSGDFAKVSSILETVEWLAGAMPSLDRVADYDASADLNAARDESSLFRRVYAARVGMLRSAESLASPPATVDAADLSAALQMLREAIASTEPLLRALDSHAPYNELQSEFILSADRAAGAASTVRKRLTSEPFLGSLVESL